MYDAAGEVSILRCQRDVRFSLGRSVELHPVESSLSFNDLFFFHLKTTFPFFTCQRWLHSPFLIQFETCLVGESLKLEMTHKRDGWAAERLFSSSSQISLSPESCFKAPFCLR